MLRGIVLWDDRGQLKPRDSLAGWRRLATAAAFLLVSCAALGVELREGYPERYQVQPGDTLWGIAAKYLDAPWLWREIWRENPGVADPDLIYPGDVLTVSYHGGQPRVSVEPGMRVVHLKPRVRTEQLDDAIPTIPINAIGPFLSRPIVAEEKAINDAPYVVGFANDRAVGGRGDTVFVRSIFSEPGTRWEILRPGKEFRDYESGERLGYEAIFVGGADLVQSGDPATLKITRSVMEVAAGDRVRAAEDEQSLRKFFPRPVSQAVKGHIISVLNGVYEIGQYDIVVFDRGKADSVEIGDVFGVYRGGHLARDRVRSGGSDWNWRNESPLKPEFWMGDWKITGSAPDQHDPDSTLPPHVQARKKTEQYVVPNQDVGTAMVFRTFSRVSFALILSATDAMHVGDIVTAPPR